MGFHRRFQKLGGSMRAVETSIGNLSSDMRLVREILQRLEDGGRQSGQVRR